MPIMPVTSPICMQESAADEGQSAFAVESKMIGPGHERLLHLLKTWCSSFFPGRTVLHVCVKPKLGKASNAGLIILSNLLR